MVGAGWFREAPGLLASPVYHDPFSVYHDPFSVYHDPFSAFFHQNNGQYTFPNSTFG